MANNPAEIIPFSFPLPKEGFLGHWSSERLVFQPPPPVAAVHYLLRAHRTSDDTWHYWTDTTVSLANAPGGAVNFDPASLVVEGAT